MNILSRVLTVAVIVLMNACQFGPPEKAKETAVTVFSETQNKCWRIPNATQIDATRCGENDLIIIRTQLASLLVALKQHFAAVNMESGMHIHISEDYESRLDNLQSNWQHWVDDQCEWETKFYIGSSAASMVRISCLATKTTERINTLRTYLCEGGETKRCPEADKFAAK